MREITDDMCRRAIEAAKGGCITGYSSPQDEARTKWGAPHFVRDEVLGKELWRGDDADELQERCAIEEMRLALRAALSDQ